MVILVAFVQAALSGLYFFMALEEKKDISYRHRLFAFSYLFLLLMILSCVNFVVSS